ncbi:MAG TPA: hypothetical protein VKT21_00865, partial [Thermoplasmata archaeon]|nr:hypothetical protein [Thermoplasmata archaeon]
MPTPCATTLGWTEGYDTYHNPFIMYDDIVNDTARCNAWDLAWTSWTRDVSAALRERAPRAVPKSVRPREIGSAPK